MLLKKLKTVAEPASVIIPESSNGTPTITLFVLMSTLNPNPSPFSGPGPFRVASKMLVIS